MMRLSLAMPAVGEEEVRAISLAVADGEISKGKSTARFEQSFAAMMGEGEAVSVVTGTSAIEVAIRALHLDGKEVVTGSMSCQATANALLAARCTLRFADHDQSTWQVSVPAVERAITRKTRAIVIAHLYGNTANLTQLSSLARARKIPLIEDCSQSLGARWGQRPVGTFGTAATFSFYGNKLITTGEGGMLWTMNRNVAKRARLLRSYGQDAPFHHVTFGLNWKMPNVLAALGVAQLKRVPGLVAARHKRMKLLRQYLSGNPEIVLPELSPELQPAPFCFPMVFPKRRADGLRKRLEEMGVENRPLFAPQFDQPCWKECAPMPRGEFPVSRYLAAHGLYVSVSPHLSEQDMKTIAECVLKALEEKRGRAHAAEAA